MEPQSDTQIIGVWSMDPTEKIPKSIKGTWIWDFRPNGHLKQTILLKGQAALSFDSSYRIKGNFILMSTPRFHDAKTRFEFTEDGALVLYYDGRHRIRHIRKT